MRLSILEIAGDPIAAGAIRGKSAFANLILALPGNTREPSPLFLDFVAIEVATASFLRESVFALKDYLRATNSTFYVVVANPNQEVWDELSVIAHSKSDAIIACKLDVDDVSSCPDIIGSLDSKQQLTYDLVMKMGNVDANLLMERYGESEGLKAPTAWNNRLASLASKGIIREYTKGRSKYYRPLI